MLTGSKFADSFDGGDGKRRAESVHSLTPAPRQNFHPHRASDSVDVRSESGSDFA
jgi:hypothetical protein